MEWLNSLPDHLRPAAAIAQQLDDFRESIGCPDGPFGIRILGSGWAIRKTLRLVYDKAKQEDPTATEPALARLVYESRQQLSRMAGVDLPPLHATCNSFDSVADFIIREEAKQAMPDPYGWGENIDGILAKA